MLPRVLEPEVMDTEEEAVSYDHMDHSEVNRAFIDRFIALGARGDVLDVGTGPAHIPLELVSRGPGRDVVAIDAALHMLSIGKQHVERAGRGRRVRLVLTDAKRLPFPDRAFDAVMSNSIMHHLPDPLPALKEIARVLRPGGALLLRDLHRPEDVKDLDRLVALHAADADPRQRALFRDSLHASFTTGEIESLLRRAGLAELKIYKSSDRHWTAEREAKLSA